MAACQGSTCKSGRAPCLSPEKCGLFNEVREMRIYLEEEMQAANTVERWAVRCFWLVVAGCVGWALYANWPILRWALN